MDSIKQLYKIGHGPSSSHTMAPSSACLLFREMNPNVNCIKVILYGSLALTGEGHLTDTVIRKAFVGLDCQIVFEKKTLLDHPNTFEIIGYESDFLKGWWRVVSVGGGTYKVTDLYNHHEIDFKAPITYHHQNFNEILQECLETKIDLYEFVIKYEGDGIVDYLGKVWKTMQESIREGLAQTGVLPGDLQIERKAKKLFDSTVENEIFEFSNQKLLSAYAYAVGETNASGGVIVTAPTCGAAGVLPGVLMYLKDTKKVPDYEIIKGLAVAGIVGNVIKHTASISGAECGCQAEIGSACSMAAAACAQIMHLSLKQIETAAEIAMEHSLGLTCDPILGYVQIPCIERNAIGTLKAVNASMLATYLADLSKVSFDDICKTMYQTGIDLNRAYKETSTGGMANLYKVKTTHQE